ncbi:MAG: PDZ domain-containing protein, partial [Phycisphaerae bacterium]
MDLTVELAEQIVLAVDACVRDVDVADAAAGFFVDVAAIALDPRAISKVGLAGGQFDDDVSREDVSYVIRELIAELNVGHAYYFGGDVESQPSVSVGMLGCDFELQNGAYKIAKIHEGAAWDADARGPLSRP